MCMFGLLAESRVLHVYFCVLHEYLFVYLMSTPGSRYIALCNKIHSPLPPSPPHLAICSYTPPRGGCRSQGGEGKGEGGRGKVGAAQIMVFEEIKQNKLVGKIGHGPVLWSTGFVYCALGFSVLWSTGFVYCALGFSVLWSTGFCVLCTRIFCTLEYRFLCTVH